MCCLQSNKRRNITEGPFPALLALGSMGFLLGQLHYSQSQCALVKYSLVGLNSYPARCTGHSRSRSRLSETVSRAMVLASRSLLHSGVPQPPKQSAGAILPPTRPGIAPGASVRSVIAEDAESAVRCAKFSGLRPSHYAASNHAGVLWLEWKNPHMRCAESCITQQC